MSYHVFLKARHVTHYIIHSCSSFGVKCLTRPRSPRKRLAAPRAYSPHIPEKQNSVVLSSQSFDRWVDMMAYSESMQPTLRQRGDSAHR